MRTSPGQKHDRPQRRPQGRRRRSTARSAAIIAGAVLALPAPALGNTSRGSSTAQRAALSQSTNLQQAIAYSRCMRSHGVPEFPDPYSSGAIPKVSLQQLGVSSAVFQAARRTCQHLLPPSAQGGPPAQAALQQAWTRTRKFAQCMRSHGVRNWPNPTSDATHPDGPTSPSMAPASTRTHRGSPQGPRVRANSRRLGPIRERRPTVEPVAAEQIN